jgi:DNA-binding NarL/FixJ family response regulator
MLEGAPPHAACALERWSMKATAPARILIVDDHPVVRLGLRRAIEDSPTLTVCCEADSEAAALASLRRSRPDMAVVDLSLGQGNGLDLIRQLHDAVPDLPVLVLSIHDEALFAERALKAGARGYVMKQEPLERLVEAIGRVLAGQIAVSERIAQTVLERMVHEPPAPAGRLGGLTDREFEVFELIGRGLGTATIARDLGVSVKTIETYRSNIKTKLGLNDANGLTRYATSWVERL